MQTTAPTLSKPTLVKVLIRAAWVLAAVYFVLRIWYGEHSEVSLALLMVPLGTAQAAHYELKLNNLRNALGNGWLAFGSAVFIVAVFGIFEHTALGRTFDHCDAVNRPRPH
jgi:hypothetical protein